MLISASQGAMSGSHVSLRQTVPSLNCPGDADSDGLDMPLGRPETSDAETKQPQARYWGALGGHAQSECTRTPSVSDTVERAAEPVPAGTGQLQRSQQPRLSSSTPIPIWL